MAHVELQGEGRQRVRRLDPDGPLGELQAPLELAAAPWYEATLVDHLRDDRRHAAQDAGLLALAPYSQSHGRQGPTPARKVLEALEHPRPRCGRALFGSHSTHQIMTG
jgi:hypothetical protein